VYSVYAALQALEISVEVADLLDHRYMGSYDGSTLAELHRAVEDHGGYARPMQGLTAAALQASSDPIILHVRRPGLHAPYAHWVLFLGVENGQARVVDPPWSVQRLPFAELLSLWDGVGLVVSARPISDGPLRVAAWLESGVVLVLIAVCLGLARYLLGQRSGATRRWWSILVVPGVALLAAVACQGLFDTGLLGNPVAVAQVVGRHFAVDLPELSHESVAALVGQPAVTFIDARFPEAYDHGHLPGAVNLPVYANLAERSEVLAAVPRQDRVVVYCQSDSCPWGRIIASDLALRGYSNVAVYSGGWAEWKGHEQRESSR
jgi:rhodanese-related sulfurtransferase